MSQLSTSKLTAKIFFVVYYGGVLKIFRELTSCMNRATISLLRVLFCKEIQSLKLLE